MKPDKLIRDCVEKMNMGMREGAFTLEELKLIEKVLERSLTVTRNTIAKAETPARGEEKT